MVPLNPVYFITVYLLSCLSIFLYFLAVCFFVDFKLSSELAEQKWSGKCLIRREKGISIHSLMLRNASIFVDGNFEKQLKSLHLPLCPRQTPSLWERLWHRLATCISRTFKRFDMGDLWIYMVAGSMKKANLHVKNCSVYWGTQEIKFWHDKTRSKGLTEYLSCKKLYGHTAQVIALGKQTNQQSPTKQQNQAIEILLQLWVVLNCFAALAKCTLVFLHRINMKKKCS